MVIDAVELYSCPTICMITTQVNNHNGGLLHLASVLTSMTAPVCHMPQCSHVTPTRCYGWCSILTSVSSTMATRSPKTLLYAVSSSMPVQTHMAHVQARSTGMHGTKQPWQAIRPSQLVLSINLNEDCQYSLSNKQPPGSHLMSLCTYGAYKPKPPFHKKRPQTTQEVTDSIIRFAIVVMTSAAAVSNRGLLTKDV